jgi:hypothetical protein
MLDMNTEQLVMGFRHYGDLSTRSKPLKSVGILCSMHNCNRSISGAHELQLVS